MFCLYLSRVFPSVWIVEFFEEYPWVCFVFSRSKRVLFEKHISIFTNVTNFLFFQTFAVNARFLSSIVCLAVFPTVVSLCLRAYKWIVDRKYCRFFRHCCCYRCEWACFIWRHFQFVYADKRISVVSVDSYSAAYSTRHTAY